MSPKRRRAARLAVGLALCLGALAPPARAEAFDPQSAGECDRLVERYPEQLEAWRCYWAIARSKGLWDEARRHLEAQLGRNPGEPAALLYLGAIERDLGSARAAALLERAAAGFEASDVGEAALGAVYARMTLQAIHEDEGRVDEAGEQLRLAALAARRAGARELEARVGISRAFHAQRRLDHAAAWRHYRRTAELLGGEGPPDLRAALDNLCGTIAWQTGRDHEAHACFERGVARWAALGDPYAEASARYNELLAASRLAGDLGLTRSELRQRAEATREAARRAGNGAIEAAALVAISQLAEEPGEAARAAGDALARAVEVRDEPSRRLALRALSTALTRGDAPRFDEALAYASRALSLAREADALDEVARSLLRRAAVLRRAGREAEARADEFRALDAIEDLRARQGDPLERARHFGTWAFAYKAAAAERLRAAWRSGDPTALDEGFRLAERYRARSLLDLVAAAQLGAEPGGERSLSQAGASSGAGEGETLRGASPSIVEVQASLRDDEALLVFLVDHPDPGALPGEGALEEAGSWLVALTRHGARVHALAGRQGLKRFVALFLGLVGESDGALRREVAGRLHELLLGEALAALPEGVERLLLVPEGPLHRLPFGALVDPARGEELSATYELARVPSATMLMRWRRQPAVPGRRAALSLAAGEGFARPDEGEVTPVDEPEAQDGPPRRASRSGGPLLPPLPRALDEARAITRAFEGSLLLAGARASESELARGLARLRPRLVHVAAHALVDEERPERSVVLLVPAEGSDGRLGASEIAALELDDALVVLAACRSASGALVEGEGVLGLAHAFFRAGARAVVGGLWEVRDDEAAKLVTRLAEELRAGHPLPAALARSQRAAIEAGGAPAEWAGFVAIGDPDLRLAEAPPRERSLSRNLFFVAVIVALLLSLSFSLARFRAR